MTDLDTLQAAGIDCSPEQIVRQLSESDPRLGALAQMWLSKREQTPADREEGDTELQQKQRDLRHLNRTVQKMYDELELLRERNDALAEALGACYLCWGADFVCPVCRGRGKPGSHRPDETLFAQYAGPALRRLRTHSASQPEPPVGSQSSLTAVNQTHIHPKEKSE